jgi:hypothetical protein
MATTAQIKSINALYVGYFDRAADPVGLQFWINAVDGGATINTIANAFAANPEAAALYPFLTTPGVTTPASFVGSIYLNLFNRTADAEGLKFWTDALAAKEVTAGDMIETITNAALTTDKTILDNKVLAGQYFTEKAASTPGYTFNNADAKASCDGVTAEESSVTASKASTDGAVAGSVAAGQGFTLTTSTTTTDAIQGTDKADTIDGSVINSLQNNDVIDGKGGIDTLNATIAGTANSAPVIVGVENINLTSIGTVANLDATNWGTAAISVTGTASASTEIENLAAGASLTMNSKTHSLTVDPLTETATNALSVTLKAGGDHGTLTVDQGGADVDALTLKSEGTADNTLTIGSAMNEGTGTTAAPRETVVIEGTNGLTLKGTAANLTGASITATALAADKSAVVDVVDTTATVFSASRLTDVDILSFSAATGSTTIAMADVSGLADKQVVQLNNNATAGLKLSSTSATATTAATLNLANADIAGAITTDTTFDIENITINSGGAANTVGTAALSAAEGASLTVTGDQNLTIGAITGAAGDKGVIDASALTGRFIMTAAASENIETVKGGTGNDTLLVQTNATTRSTVVDGGAGNDIITMSSGSTGEKAIISVGAGNNTVTLSVSQETVDLSSGGIDTVQFVDAATVDADVIIGFQTGTDKLSFNGLTGITVTAGVAVDASGAAVVVADDTVVVVSGGAALASPTTVNAALATALTTELTIGNTEQSIVVYNDSASGNAFIYAIDNQAADVTIDVVDITLIGTVTGSNVASGDIA